MEHEPDFRPAVRRAADILGSYADLDRAVGRRGATWTALHTRKKLPAWLAVRISEATGGEVSLKDLLPDVYQRVEKEITERMAL